MSHFENLLAHWLPQTIPTSPYTSITIKKVNVVRRVLICVQCIKFPSYSSLYVMVFCAGVLKDEAFRPKSESQHHVGFQCCI